MHMPSFPADVAAQNREGLIPNSTKNCTGLKSTMRNRAVTVFVFFPLHSQWIISNGFILWEWTKTGRKKGETPMWEEDPHVSLNTQPANWKSHKQE